MKSLLYKRREKEMIEQRSFAKYLLLSILTCGIYALYFWYRYAEDMNLMCQGDGEETTNYLLAWLFGILTCGIYLWYWFYQVGNRIQKNGKRYGVTIVENGSSVILWLIIGTYLTCGIAALFAYYILVKNFNQLADGYNNQMGGGGYQSQGPQTDYPQGAISYDTSYNGASGGEQTVGYNMTSMPGISGRIFGISGEYAGQEIPIGHMETIVIGRNPNECNIVLTGNKVSRKHCSIMYNSDSNRYSITDYSSNGTYQVADRKRFANYGTEEVPAGTEIYLGDESNSFRLG